MKKSALILLNVLFFSFSYAQTNSIVLDENFDDWNSVQNQYVDADAQIPLGIDFTKAKIYNDDSRLFLLLELNEEINLQNDNNIVIYIDTDNNSATGLLINGIGAEFKYLFGSRYGEYYSSQGTTTIYQNNLGLSSSPTVTSNKFEIVFDLHSQVNGSAVFTSNQISIVWENKISSGDLLPNNGESFNYTIDEASVFTPKVFSINKASSDEIRIVSNNVLRDNLFASEKRNNFKRIYQALNPDIIGFQEIYNHTGNQTADLIAEFLPLPSGEQWYGKDVGNDNILVSRFPITAGLAIDGNAAFKVKISDNPMKEMLVISAHPPCCANDENRQMEIDHFMAFVRNIKDGVAELTIEQNSPIIIVGDMNLVGLNQQQRSLITGDIVNENIYGMDFSPDWDNTDFEDAKPFTINLPATFTWYDEGSSFSPGRLDYMIYSGSVLTLENSFVFFSKSLTQQQLSDFNLNENDNLLASDHLPVVADFKVNGISAVKNIKKANPDGVLLNQNYPNPVSKSTAGTIAGNSITIISFEIREQSNVKLDLFNVLGQKIAALFRGVKPAGVHELTLNVKKLNSGVYFYKLEANGLSLVRKIVVVQ